MSRLTPTQSRLYSTNLGSFHTIAALSEDHINKSFKAMYELALIDDPQSPICNFNIPHNAAGFIKDAVLKPPRIKLLVAGGETSTLLYYLAFDKGELNLYESDDRADQTTKTFQVKDWVFVFKIDLVQKGIAKDTDEYKKYAPRVPYPNGTFSLSKLFLDASTAKMSGASTDAESKFGDTDWSKENATVRSNWSAFVIKWVALAAEKGQTLIGLQPTPDKNLTEATYPPTFVQKQTYAWLDPESSSPQAQDGNPQNALMYLCLTDNQDPPSPPRLEAHSGTWISTKDNIKGTFAMSADRFWGVWLLPTLNEFNKKLQFYFKPCKASAWWDDGTPYVNSTYYPAMGGPLPAAFPQAAFSKGDLPRANLPSDRGLGRTLTPDTQGAARYYWLGPVISDSDSDQNGSAWPHGRLRMQSQQQMYNWSAIWFSPGSDTITFEGKGGCYLRDDLLGSDTPAWTTGEQFYLNLTFKVVIKIVDIAGGALNLKIQDADNVDKIYTLTGDHSDSLGGTIFPRRFDTYYTNVKNYLNAQIGYNVKDAVAQLEKVLNHEHKLILPGAGEYLFEKGTFNNNGDFLAQIHFNGTDAPGQ